MLNNQNLKFGNPVTKSSFSSKYEEKQALSEYLNYNFTVHPQSDLLKNYNHVLMRTLQQDLNLDINEDLIELLKNDFMLDRRSIENPEKGENNKISGFEIEKVKDVKASSPKIFENVNKNSYQTKWKSRHYYKKEASPKTGIYKSQFSQKKKLSNTYENKENVYGWSSYNSNSNYQDYSYLRSENPEKSQNSFSFRKEKYF